MLDPIASGSRTSPTLALVSGASAGCFESLEKLLQNLPAETGMAFVVTQHLSPDFESMMNELLALDTTMVIHHAEDGMQIEENRSYLRPSERKCIIAGGELHLIDKDLGKDLALSIERFLNRWLASEVKGELGSSYQEVARTPKRF